MYMYSKLGQLQETDNFDTFQNNSVHGTFTASSEIQKKWDLEKYFTYHPGLKTEQDCFLEIQKH